MRRSELSRKVCGWLVRGGIAAAGDCLRSPCRCCVTPTVTEGAAPLKLKE